MKPFDHKKFVKELPKLPGVYQMFDGNNEVIYVGKARVLKNRVGSYFTGQAKDNKTMALVAAIKDMSFHITRSEAEALLLENQLIKKHNPRYNVLLKDGKSYPYIYCSVGVDEFPLLEFRRGKKQNKGRFFGPFPSAAYVRNSLHFLQKVFKVRQCNNSTFNNRSRPCLQHQINRCTAPCVGYVTQEEYQQQLKYTFDFIEGKSNQVVDSLMARMEQAAEQQDYEQAASFRDQIKAIRMIQSKQTVELQPDDNFDMVVAGQQGNMYIATVGTVRNGQFMGYRNHFPATPKGTSINEFLYAFIGLFYDNQITADAILCNTEPSNKSELADILSSIKGKKVFITAKPKGNKLKLLKQAEENMRNALIIKANKYQTWQNKWALWQKELGFKDEPKRIECFDISHQMGEHTRASCVVFDDQGAVKKMYRQYIMENITAADDYAAMRQVIEKRLASIKKRKLGFPDAFVIDGGKGQVNQAIAILEEHAITSIRVIGVTKDDNRTAGEERIYLPESKTFIKPESHGLLSLMIQFIRDEAHRFAIKSHRKAYKKSRTTSTLEDIPGIGEKRRNQLLKHFGGLQGLNKASLEDITKVEGISETMAKTIYDFLHQKATQ
ncbi:excinuclease ABC subunit UvrC [Marinicella sp. S1101]|uniref:excinuclease ABC subunit UvrC n=1 Tax=Marinicella marina TaxID=2996016 RepID=UPI002260F498|nr:excinuclease ABC subunit UvrC [Marinicella marina]MCX7553535.1 excinuclease ABC subunit UvrC [Marinicella marina]MDJ1140159.1 excinuclease ABC subunit UvrC [Marinicella marina]